MIQTITILSIFIICLSFTSASRLPSSQLSVKFDGINSNLASIEQKRALLESVDVIDTYLKVKFKEFMNQETESVVYSDFNDLMISLGITLTAEEIIEQLQVFDSDCDGLISYQEYIEAMESYIDIEPEEPEAMASPLLLSVPIKHEKVAVDAPVNDYACGAEVITETVVYSTSTLDATIGNFPFCDTPNTSPGVWFKIPGPIKDLTVSTCELNSDGGADFDTKISVFGPECGCSPDCSEEESFVCIAGNDDTPNTNFCGGTFQSTVSITGTYCDLYVVLHAFGGDQGDADVSFAFTVLDEPCRRCVTDIATKGECETCLSWNSYLDVGCKLDFDPSEVTLDNIASRIDECVDGFICLLNDEPGERLKKSVAGHLEFEPTVRTGICVPRNGTSTSVSICMTDQDCPSCMRCCADSNGNKQCARSSGDICGLEFEGRGPCCCPEYTCKSNECITQSPTPAPTELPTPALTELPTELPTPAPTELPNSAPTSDGDDDHFEIFGADKKLDLKDKNENKNSDDEFILEISSKTLINLWSVVVISIIALIICAYFCFYRKKQTQASFENGMDMNEMNQNV